ncbi:(5-formylfuran-3-yl)methyl phosphate transaminase [uncultured archaeon]|nr:(5-formylfuran-3-yl)methyl phosphate transaminase [uncultured archaeon]
MFQGKPLSRRMDHVQYAIRELYPVAEKLERAGEEIAKVNIGDPVPYFGTPKYILDAYSKAVLEGKTGYGRSPGETGFLEAISERYARLYERKISPSDIFATHGVTEAIQFTNACLMEKGSGCIMFSPFYPADLPLVREYDGTAYFAESTSETNWAFDMGSLEEAANKAEKNGTDLKYVNLINPCNPTGSVWERGDLEKIAKFAREKGLLLVSDETYDEIVFSGKFMSMSEVTKSQPLMVLNGLSKNWRATGLRIGWLALLGDPDSFERLKDGISRLATVRLCPGMAQQYAGIEALSNVEEHEKALRPFNSEVKARSEYFCRRLNEIPGVSCAPAKGTFYLFPKIDVRAAKCRDDTEFTRKLLEREKVWAVQGAGFGREGFIRVVALPEIPVIDKACDGIARMMKG